MSRLSSLDEPSPKSAHPGRGVLLAGVAAAALMGVGLGLWARPAMSERKLALAAIEAPKPSPLRTLQIVVLDAPAPLGAPIEVLPASAQPKLAPPRAAPPERLPPEPLAPVRPATGLVRVQTVEPAEAAPLRAAPKPKPSASPRLATPKPVKIKAVAPPSAKLKPLKVEKVKVVAKPKPRPVMATVARAEPKPVKAGVRLAKADRREKPARVERVDARRTAKPTALVRVVERVAPQKPAPKVLKAKLEQKAAKTPKPRVEKVVQRAKPVKAAPPKALQAAKGAGPVRVAKAAPRPDTAIRDADRQMNRAYSSARAAGVPDWQLRRQQARWEAARASAAREAPWAVHDVYLARIAELHDLTKDAQGSGY